MNSKALKHFERARCYDQTDPERAQRHRQRGRELQFGKTPEPNPVKAPEPNPTQDDAKHDAYFAKALITYAATASFCCKAQDDDKNFITGTILKYPETEYGGGMTNLLNLLGQDNNKDEISSYLQKVWNYNFHHPENANELKKIAGKIIIYVAYQAYVKEHAAYRDALTFTPGLKGKVHDTVRKFLLLNIKDDRAKTYLEQKSGLTFDHKTVKKLSKGLITLHERIPKSTKSNKQSLPPPPKVFTEINASMFNNLGETPKPKKHNKKAEETHTTTPEEEETPTTPNSDDGTPNSDEKKEEETPKSDEKEEETPEPYDRTPTTPDDGTHTSDLLESIRQQHTLKSRKEPTEKPSNISREMQRVTKRSRYAKRDDEFTDGI
jgi:hypothetical protein